MYQFIKQREESKKKRGKKEKKIGEPDFYRSVMVEMKLKGVCETERWRCEAEKSKREKK